MHQYKDLLHRVLGGTKREDRTGTGTLSIFGHQMRFDLTAGFPVVTTKRVHLKSVIYELLWFLQGNPSLDYLHEHSVTIWDEWALPDGTIGPIYGHQWRSWPTPDGTTIDQLQQIIDLIQTEPTSRRLLVSAWNVADIHSMALPPCPVLFQFYVADGRLSCQVYQRSADVFLGLPFNIASYALLTHMVARLTRLQPGDLIFSIGDAHLYLNHVNQALTQLTRNPLPLPTLQLSDVQRIDDFRYDHIHILGYQSHPAIPAPISV